MLVRLDTLRFSEREDCLKFLSLLRLNISVRLLKGESGELEELVSMLHENNHYIHNIYLHLYINFILFIVIYCLNFFLVFIIDQFIFLNL